MTFFFYIGGLLIRVENDIKCSIPQDGAQEYLPFLCSENTSVTADIQISMKQISEFFNSEDDKLLFSSQHVKVRSAANGFQVLRYWSEEQQAPFISVWADSSFCRLECCFFPDAIELPKNRVIDQWRTAADAVLLQHSFITHQGMLIHAGGGSIMGKGMIFAGASGAGKSTLSALLNSSSKNQLFSDERLVVRFSDDKWNIWGTPWQGTGNIARNENAQLSALVFLRQSEKTQITPLTSSQGLHRLLQVVSVPWYSEEWTEKGLALCESLVLEMPMYELSFKPDLTALKAVEDLASGLP
ncbi:hypothetical protein KKHLCK_14505 [Candidatus Electrothrix laxa]